MQVHILFGPTRVGKSKKAQELWKVFHYPIVSVDSRKVYKGMDIGTNKLEALKFIAQEPSVLYGGVDFVSPNQTMSVFEYQQEVYRWLTKYAAEITSAGGLILHGGTGLYLDSLLFGLSVDVTKDPTFRTLAETMSLGELQDLIQKENPTRWETMNESDRMNKRRLIRGVEIGRSSAKIDTNKAMVHPILEGASFIWYDLETEREQLYQNIDNRVDRYVSEGWLEEVDRLIATYGYTAPGLQVMGYREIAEYMKKNKDWRNLVQKNAPEYLQVLSAIRQQHRNYAKRQITWGKRYKGLSV